MRTVMVFLASWLSTIGALDQKQTSPAPRYGQEARLDQYPQGTPQETLASVLKAIDDGRVNYLLAQLVDPEFVDARVKSVNGKFDEVVRETAAKLRNEPGAVTELRRFLQEGKVEPSDDTAVIRLEEVRGRAVFLRKIDNRWFFENRDKPEAKAK